jgi:hypothetical protein
MNHGPARRHRHGAQQTLRRAEARATGSGTVPLIHANFITGKDAGRMAKVIVSLMLLLTACGPTNKAKPETASLAPQDPALIARFTTVIWPTILTYRFYGQGDPQTPPNPNSDRDKFNSVVDVNSQTGWDVKLGAEKIGEVLNAQGISAGETDQLALATATISSPSATDAHVIVCYTYSFTARSEWPHTNDHAVPGASEVTFALHKGNGDWLVRGIVNDHVVPSCPSNRA